MKKIKTNCLIIGGGAGGLSAGISFLKNFNQNQEYKKCLIINPKISNSIISPWNMIVSSPEEIKTKIKNSGDNLSNNEILEIFAKNYDSNFKIFNELNIDLKESNLGKIPVLKGSQVVDKFRKKFEELGGEIIYSAVTNFLINNNSEIKGVGIRDKEEIEIIADQIIIASGGMTNLYEYTTGYSDNSIHSILALSLDAGIELENLEFNMFHPFLIIDKKFPKMLVSGEILQKVKYIDFNKKEFLSEKIKNALKNNQHHSVFPEMTREFYIQSLKSKIYMDFTEISEDYFEKYKKENEFGWIFNKKNLDEVGELEIHPAFHYSIGGIKINSQAKTNKKNIYAVGEVTSGLHGSNRIGGFAVKEALILGEIAGKQAAQNAKPLIFEKLKKIGNSKITENLKNEFWKNLGPIKNDKKLKLLIENLEKKDFLFSEERLLLKMAKSSLKQESIGTHFKQNI